MLAFLKVLKIEPPKALNIAVFDHLTSFDVPVQGVPANIRINLIMPETRATGLHLCSW